MCRHFRSAGVLVAVALLVAACARDGGDGGSARAARPTTTTSSLVTTSDPATTSTTSAPASTTSSPPSSSATRAPAPVATTGPQPATATCPATPARHEPRADRPVYSWQLHVDLAGGAVDGRGTLAFTPDADTDRVVIRLWANSPRIARAGGRIEVAVDGDTPFSQPEPTRLVLGVPARKGQRFTTGLTFHLTFPTGETDDRIYRAGDTLRLGSFLPVIAWEPGVGWQEQPPTSGFAEASTSVTSDYSVGVDGLPEGVEALATGVRDASGRWVANAVAEWAMSAGRFSTVSADVDGVHVVVGVDAAVNEPASAYLDKVVGVLRRFAELYGPYPWPSYTLAVTPGLKGGIENPMHVMQGPGTIGRTTSHEIGHMWFYGLVSNNQGRDPWLDEGLATWAEGRFEGTTSSFMARDVPPAGQGHAGEPMTYWESRQSIYYRSVYVQGAQAIGALAPGDPARVDCALRLLVATQAYETTSPAELAAAVTPVFPAARDVLARYGIHT